MIGIIILAAGASSRLGSAKQSLNYQGKTLLQRSIETALSSACDTVAVVLGANAGILRSTIIDQPVHIFLNADWEEGMASSIRFGLNELQKVEPQLKSAMLMLCDQPYVDKVIIDQLIQKKLANKIIASFYNDTVGPPALFSQEFFPELLSLSGHEGAKRIILKHPGSVIAVPFPLGAIDIDTINDYDQLGTQTENL